MSINKLVVLLFLLIFSTIANSASILAVYPIFARSHFAFGNAVMKSLHKAGHQITFINPFPPNQKTENFTVIDSSQVDQQPDSPNSSVTERTQMSRITILRELLKWDLKDCVQTLNMKFIQDILKENNKQFDVIFVNLSTKTWKCFAAIAEVLDIPVIGLITNRSWKIVECFMGSPSNPAVLPHEFSSYSKIETFFSKLTNVWYSVLDDLHEYFAVQPAMKEIFRQYFPKIRENTLRKPSLIFSNGHPVLFSRPLPPNIIEIGGVHVNREQSPLPKDLNKFLDEAPKGVIMFSLGSMLDGDSLPPKVLNAFINVFAKIPQRVLWKLGNSPGNLSDNVLPLKWIQQNAVLAHKNVVAFITHCGISSMYEAIYFSKPLVMIPAFLDQVSNAKKMEDFGVGIRLDLMTVNEDLLFEALNSVVNDIRYKQKMEGLSKLTKDRPITPQEAVVYGTEYVIRQNGVHFLQPVAAAQPLYQYLLVDIVALLIFIMLVIILVVLKII